MVAPGVTDQRREVPRSLLLGLAGLGLFVAALDAYLVVTLLPAMIADIGLTIDRFEQATPIVTGFLCGYVIAMPLLGAYYDVRGRAPVYAACKAWAEAALCRSHWRWPPTCTETPGGRLRWARWPLCKKPGASSDRFTVRRWHRRQLPSVAGASCSG